MTNFLKQYWPSIVHVALVLAGFLTPSIQAYATGHPASAAAVLTVWGIVLHHLPAPK